MAHPIEEEIQQELQQHKILIYGKGTKTAPQCGFTVETMEFFNQFGYPYEIVNVLENPEKREVLTQMTNWPTLPKVSSTANSTATPTSWVPCSRKGN